eukprot:NODE_13254_length_1176_cov_4.428027.p1 GENE.NODE_13254_length_1176_cov_4.428027~~NODE_13254_length_1176_cov_4.428027.p1  ORF type:complete len:305 (+),score=66.13 NODE_13254_length_1176_cov_4.428027:95-1009(+)
MQRLQPGALIAAPPPVSPWQDDGYAHLTGQATQDVKANSQVAPMLALVVFFGLFEGFTLFWLFGALMATIASRGTTFIMPLFGFGFHLITQLMISKIDPGGCMKIVQGLDSDTDDVHTIANIHELRAVRPRIDITVEAYHKVTTGSGKNRSTKTVVTYTNTQEFVFSDWVDVSGEITGLEKYAVAAVTLEACFKPADEPTAIALKQMIATLDADVQGRDQFHTRRITVVLDHPTSPVQGHRMFITKTRSDGGSMFLNAKNYRIGPKLCPFVGTIFRIAILSSISRLTFQILKVVSLRPRPQALQ